ncbi:unnamed protein product [Chrysoparadoxa australica]
MRITQLLGLGVLALVGAAVAEPELDEGVVVLTDEIFEEFISSTAHVMVEFYAPWCGHCKKLAPEYVSAAAALKEAGSEVVLAKVDATEHPDAASKHGVRGYPTLKFFNGGVASDYEGGRTSDELVKYAIKKSGPPATTVTTVDEAKALEALAPAVVLGCFGSETSDAAKTFLKVASANDALPFGITTEKKVIKEYGVKADSVVVLKTFDEKKADLSVSGKTTDEELSAWIGNYSRELVMPFSPENSRVIFGGPVQVHMLAFGAKGEEKADALFSTLAKVAEKQRGEVIHVSVEPTEERVMEFFGLTADSVPAVVMADMRGDMKKYSYEGDLTEAGLLQFEKDLFAGKLKPTLKSEEPSEEDLAKPVKVIKGTSFADIVLNNENDVLVEFYAPWCGHCKALEPKYDELAAKLEDNPSITIAKMDSTANEIDVAGVEVQGFPTLFFFPGKDKSSPMQYQGAREVDDLLQFITENASGAIKAGAGEEL